MRIYLAPFTNDELISDKYPMFDDVEHGALRFEGRYMDVESEDEENPGVTRVIDVVHFGGLFRIDLTKNLFNHWAKSFIPTRLKQLSEGPAERADKFKRDGQIFIKWVVDNFDEFDFFTGSSNDPNDFFLFCKHDESGSIPFFYLIADAVESEKC